MKEQKFKKLLTEREMKKKAFTSKSRVDHIRRIIEQGIKKT